MLVVRCNIHVDPMESSNSTLAIFDSRLPHLIDAKVCGLKMQIQAGAKKVRVQTFLAGHPIRISQTKETDLSDLRRPQSTSDCSPESV